MTAIIEFKHVDKYYGKLHALKDINLKIDEGQVVSIIGPSGSGKSTLIRTMNGLEPINSGQLIVTGYDLADKKTDIDWRDAYVRLAADFDNYRKRTAKEQDDIRRRERERVIDIWLDVYDNAERALASLPEKEGPWFEGFSSLVHQMDRCLATFHIRACDDMGKPFDPKRHEAIATCPNPAMENNMIMHIERRGFEYENGDIARVARVIVVRNPS